MRSPRTHLAYRETAREQVRRLYTDSPSEDAIAARYDFEKFRWFVKKFKTYEHHKSWARYLNTGEDSRCLNAIAGDDLLILAPRGSSKSTFLIEWCAWQIGRHAAPDIGMALKILYVSYELKTARQKSQQIKRMLQLPEYKKVFPWVRPGENWANELWEIDFAHAGLPAADEPYTVAAAGLIGNVTGKRCVTGDTLIQARTGLVPIKDFHSLIGTEVLSAQAWFAPQWRRVKGFMVQGSEQLVTVKTESGRTLRCTPKHPIYWWNQGYVEARNLKVGDRLLVTSQSNPEALAFDEVESIIFEDCHELVYDIEVEENHNFFANDILCHNCHISVYDDLIKSPEAIANPDIREQMSSNYKNIIKPTRFEGGRSVCLGTRMREDDIYCTDFIPEKNWQVIEQSAILTRPDGSEYSYWEPEDDEAPGQSLHFLRSIRDNPDEFETFCFQYQNVIIKGIRKNQTFDPSWIVDGMIPNQMLQLVLGVDLSAGQKQTNDYTAFCLGGMALADKVPHFYTIDCHEERIMGNNAKLKAIHDLYNCWKHLCPHLWIYVESNGYQLSFAGDYQDYVAKHGLYDWHIVPVPSTVDKLARLRSVTGVLENRCHTFNKYCRLSGKLKYQLTQHGATKFDDLADAWEKMLNGLRSRMPLTFA